MWLGRLVANVLRDDSVTPTNREANPPPEPPSVPTSERASSPHRARASGAFPCPLLPSTPSPDFASTEAPSLTPACLPSLTHLSPYVPSPPASPFSADALSAQPAWGRPATERAEWRKAANSGRGSSNEGIEGDGDAWAFEDFDVDGDSPSSALAREATGPFSHEGRDETQASVHLPSSSDPQHNYALGSTLLPSSSSAPSASYVPSGSASSQSSSLYPASSVPSFSSAPASSAFPSHPAPSHADSVPAAWGWDDDFEEAPEGGEAEKGEHEDFTPQETPVPASHTLRRTETPEAARTRSPCASPGAPLCAAVSTLPQEEGTRKFAEEEREKDAQRETEGDTALSPSSPYCEPPVSSVKPEETEHGSVWNTDLDLEAEGADSLEGNIDGSSSFSSLVTKDKSLSASHAPLVYAASSPSCDAPLPPSSLPPSSLPPSSLPPSSLPPSSLPPSSLPPSSLPPSSLPPSSLPPSSLPPSSLPPSSLPPSSLPPSLRPSVFSPSSLPPSSVLSSSANPPLSNSVSPVDLGSAWDVDFDFEESAHGASFAGGERRGEETEFRESAGSADPAEALERPTSWNVDFAVETPEDSSRVAEKGTGEGQKAGGDEARAGTRPDDGLPSSTFQEEVLLPPSPTLDRESLVFRAEARVPDAQAEPSAGPRGEERAGESVEEADAARSRPNALSQSSSRAASVDISPSWNVDFPLEESGSHASHQPVPESEGDGSGESRIGDGRGLFPLGDAVELPSEWDVEFDLEVPGEARDGPDEGEKDKHVEDPSEREEADAFPLESPERTAEGFWSGFEIDLASAPPSPHTGTARRPDEQTAEKRREGVENGDQEGEKEGENRQSSGDGLKSVSVDVAAWDADFDVSDTSEELRIEERDEENSQAQPREGGVEEGNKGSGSGNRFLRDEREGSTGDRAAAPLRERVAAPEYPYAAPVGRDEETARGAERAGEHEGKREDSEDQISSLLEEGGQGGAEKAPQAAELDFEACLSPRLPAAVAADGRGEDGASEKGNALANSAGDESKDEGLHRMEDAETPRRESVGLGQSRFNGEETPGKGATATKEEESEEAGDGANEEFEEDGNRFGNVEDRGDGQGGTVRSLFFEEDGLGENEMEPAQRGEQGWASEKNLFSSNSPRSSAGTFACRSPQQLRPPPGQFQGSSPSPFVSLSVPVQKDVSALFAPTTPSLSVDGSSTSLPYSVPASDRVLPPFPEERVPSLSSSVRASASSCPFSSSSSSSSSSSPSSHALTDVFPVSLHGRAGAPGAEVVGETEEEQRRHEEERDRKRKEDEEREIKRQEDEERERKRQEDEERERKRQEEEERERKRQEDEERERKRQEEEERERKRQEDEERERKRQEDEERERKRQEDEERERKRQEDEERERKRQEDEERERKRQEEEEREIKRQEDEERERKRQEDEERERKRQEDEERERKRQEEEEREKKRQEEERERKRQEDEERERKRQEDEERERKRQEDEERERKRQEEEERERKRQEEEERERKRQEKEEEREREFEEREAELKASILQLQRKYEESVERWAREREEREGRLAQEWERKLHAVEETNRTVLLQEKSRLKQCGEENAKLKMQVDQLSRDVLSLQAQLVVSEEDREKKQRLLETMKKREEEERVHEERDTKRREELRKEREAFFLLLERDREDLKKHLSPALSELQEGLQRWRQQWEGRAKEAAAIRRRGADENARLASELMQVKAELDQERRQHRDRVTLLFKEKEGELQQERDERRRLARQLQAVLRMQGKLERSDEEGAEMQKSVEAIEAKYFAAELQRCRSAMEAWNAEKADLLRIHEERERQFAEEIQSLAAAGAEERACCDKLLKVNEELAQEMEKLEGAREELETKEALEEEERRERLRRQIFELQCELQQREKENGHLRTLLRLLDQEEEPLSSPFNLQSSASSGPRQPQPGVSQSSLPGPSSRAVDGPSKTVPHLSSSVPVPSPVAYASSGSGDRGLSGASRPDPAQGGQVSLCPVSSQESLQTETTPPGSVDASARAPASRAAFLGPSFSPLQAPQEERMGMAAGLERAREEARGRGAHTGDTLGPAASAVSVASAAAAVATSLARSAFAGAFFGGREAQSLDALQKHLKFQRETEERERIERERREREEREQREVRARAERERTEEAGGVGRETEKTGWEEDFDFDEVNDTFVNGANDDGASAVSSGGSGIRGAPSAVRSASALQNAAACTAGGERTLSCLPGRPTGLSAPHCQPVSSICHQNALTMQTAFAPQDPLQNKEQAGETGDRLYGDVPNQVRSLSTPQAAGGWGNDQDFDFSEDEFTQENEEKNAAPQTPSAASTSLHAFVPHRTEDQALPPSLSPRLSAVRCGGSLAPRSPDATPLLAPVSPVSSVGFLAVSRSLEQQSVKDPRGESGARDVTGNEHPAACNVGVGAYGQTPVEGKQIGHERRHDFVSQESSWKTPSLGLPPTSGREETPAFAQPTEPRASPTYTSGPSAPGPQVSRHPAAGGVHGGVFSAVPVPAHEQTRLGGGPFRSAASGFVEERLHAGSGVGDSTHAFQSVCREPADVAALPSSMQMPPSNFRAKCTGSAEFHANAPNSAEPGVPAQPPRRLVLAGQGASRGALGPAWAREAAVQDIDLEDFLNS
uniref:Non-specific serine/threonine protein kinase n=1 Tax=Neospora caninum (strain Liverpool) TaxID=572307 RepID=A0A0F7U6W8_NEOCL|nr:TPA: non-specific serine/threonine protein kinase [Neospora caninum Liverpool]